MTPDLPTKEEKTIERKIERKILQRYRKETAFTGLALVGFIGWCIVMPFLIFIVAYYFFKAQISSLPPSGKALIIFGCFVFGVFNSARYIKKENDIITKNNPTLPRDHEKDGGK